MRIGAAAYIDKGGSVHTETFLRSIKMGVEISELEFGSKVKLVLANDFASAAGGAAAAAQLVDQKVDVVVGHYASAAAASAIPVYEKRGTPLILPAASASDLTGADNVFRMCVNDSLYAKWIVDTFETAVQTMTLWIASDGSHHGKSVIKNVMDSMKGRSIKIVDSIRDAETVLFSGMYANTIDFLRKTDFSGRIFVTDDMCVNHLREHDIETGRLYVFAFDRYERMLPARRLEEYRKQYNEEPGIYFWETVAAMQIAAQSVLENKPLLKKSGHDYNTVIGGVRFDEFGESNLSACKLYKFDRFNNIIELERPYLI